MHLPFSWEFHLVLAVGTHLPASFINLYGTQVKTQEPFPTILLPKAGEFVHRKHVSSLKGNGQVAVIIVATIVVFWRKAKAHSRFVHSIVFSWLLASGCSVRSNHPDFRTIPPLGCSLSRTPLLCDIGLQRYPLGSGCNGIRTGQRTIRIPQ